MFYLIFTLNILISINWQSIPLPKTIYDFKKIIICKNNVYISSNNQLIKYTNKNFKKIFITSPYNPIEDITCYKDSIIVLTKKKIFTLSKENIIQIAKIPDREESIKFSNNDPPEIITNKGIYLLKYNLKKIFHFNSFNITNAALGRKKILFSTFNQLWLYSQGNFKLLGNIKVYDICFIPTYRKFYISINKPPEAYIPSYIRIIYNHKKLKCQNNGIIKIGDKKVSYNNKTIYEGSDIISADITRKQTVILTENHILLMRSQNLNYFSSQSPAKINCPRLPSLYQILANSFHLQKIRKLLNINWIKNSRKRGYIPKITLSSSINVDNGGYVNKSDNISVSSYNEIVIIGPPSKTYHNDRNTGFSISLSLTWDPEKLFFDPDELSIAYRITDLIEEEHYILQKIIDIYSLAQKNMQKCCNKNDRAACIQLKENIDYLKYITSNNIMLWEKEAK